MSPLNSISFLSHKKIQYHFVGWKISLLVAMALWEEKSSILFSFTLFSSHSPSWVRDKLMYRDEENEEVANDFRQKRAAHFSIDERRKLKWIIVESFPLRLIICEWERKFSRRKRARTNKKFMYDLLSNEITFFFLKSFLMLLELPLLAYNNGMGRIFHFLMLRTSEQPYWQEMGL